MQHTAHFFLSYGAKPYCRILQQHIQCPQVLVESFANGSPHGVAPDRAGAEGPHLPHEVLTAVAPGMPWVEVPCLGLWENRQTLRSKDLDKDFTKLTLWYYLCDQYL